jgi:uncharacterized protein
VRTSRRELHSALLSRELPLALGQWQQLLQLQQHRPWPLPAGRFLMTMSWHDLLFAHWRVPVSALRALVPAGLELELWQGEAWIGVVPFHMTQVGPPVLHHLPWLSEFSELNVRTYVRCSGKSGVFFFSLDAACWPAVLGARVGFRLPYFWAHIDCRNEGSAVQYTSERVLGPAARFVASYQPCGAVALARPGSFEHWLTERYCLYTTGSAGHVLRGDIQHAPWPLQAAQADIRCNGMLAWLGLQPLDAAPVLHFARRLDVLAWPLERA